jgi:hypothetical protein
MKQSEEKKGNKRRFFFYMPIRRHVSLGQFKPPKLDPAFKKVETVCKSVRWND